MLLSELNLRALGVSASSVLPLSVSVAIEGKELNFIINEFKTGFGSGKKSVISGSIQRVDNNTTKVLENSDIEKVRRVCASLCELTISGRTSERKPRAPKERTKVEELRQLLAVARRLPKAWVKIDAAAVWKAYQEAKAQDAKKAQDALKEKAVNPLLSKIAKLSAEERALLLASLQ